MLAKRMILLIAVMLMLGTDVVMARGYGDHGASVGQVFSDELAHMFEVGVMLTGESDLSRGGDVYQVDADSDWALAYVNNFGGGELDVGLIVNSTIFSDDAGVGLPGAVARISLEIGTIWKANDVSFGLRASPGLYSDMDGITSRDFAYPFSGIIGYSFHPQFAGIVGFEFRSKFERNLMPILAMAWTPGDVVRLYAGIPRTRLLFKFRDKFRMYLDGEWRSTTYDLSDPGDRDRDALTVEDIRLGVGFVWNATDKLQLGVEGGVLRNRSLDFERGTQPDEEHEVESSRYFRFSVGSPF